MSYCVNCGVELKQSEKRCPLCDTLVLNPNTIGDIKQQEPQKEYERIDTVHVDYRLLSTILSVLLIIPIAVTLICDIVQTHKITWSLYVLGASILVFVTLFLPAFFRNKRPYKFIIADAVAAFLYLLLINYMTGGGWAFRLALPMCAVTMVLSLILAAAIRNKKIDRLIKISIFVVMVGFFALCTEVIINDAFGRAMSLVWSHFVMIPCAVLSIVFIIINTQKKLKEELRKKLFM